MAGPAAATAAIDGKAGRCEAVERGGSSGARGAREMTRGAPATEYAKLVYESPNPKGTTGVPV
jgi:hypothetical protein